MALSIFFCPGTRMNQTTLAARRLELNRAEHIYDPVPSTHCMLCGAPAREDGIAFTHVATGYRTSLEGGLCETHGNLLAKALKRIVPKRRFQIDPITY